ncbi:hypothetical protein GCK72_016358 [Caenorhabditis remanei]|uniref:Uncharacterized protein n=1 Tax=Caenorhabditis remanei TaxID=31234 RepID=A0A6A5GYU2_CAERE|nr:hypothetical protein GCK72_016358 [Caenorhabditis remanei]KAF1759891.1 hypothetical protein GCK72_016358 [Caenorhabditis remanei]
MGTNYGSMANGDPGISLSPYLMNTNPLTLSGIREVGSWSEWSVSDFVSFLEFISIQSGFRWSVHLNSKNSGTSIGCIDDKFTLLSGGSLDKSISRCEDSSWITKILSTDTKSKWRITHWCSIESDVNEVVSCLLWHKSHRITLSVFNRDNIDRVDLVVWSNDLRLQVSFGTMSEDGECECFSSWDSLIVELSQFQLSDFSGGWSDEYFEWRVWDVLVVELDRHDVLSWSRNLVVDMTVSVFVVLEFKSSLGWSFDRNSEGTGSSFTMVDVEGIECSCLSTDDSLTGCSDLEEGHMRWR